MRKFTRISLIVVAAMAGAGFVLMGIASAMGAGYGTIRRMMQSGELNFDGWHFDNGFYWDGSDEDDDFQVNAGGVYSYPVETIRNLDLDFDAADLKVLEGEDDSHIVVKIKGGKTDYFEGGMDGDTLKLSYGMKRQKSVPGITVEIPEGMSFGKLSMEIGASDVRFEPEDIVCEELSMDAGAGSVSFQDLQVTGKLSAAINAGNITFEDMVCQTAELDCDLGSVFMSGTIAGDLKAECNMGSIELCLAGNENDYNYDLSCDMGELSVNGEQYTDIGGSRKVTNQGAVGTIEVSCNMGTVYLDIE